VSLPPTHALGAPRRRWLGALWCTFALTLLGACASGTPSVDNEACTTAGRICFGGQAIVCTGPGMAESVDDCFARGAQCDPERGCMECTSPGARECRGDTLITCSGDARITDSRDCFAEGLVCADGARGCTVCVPESGSCAGNTPRVCNRSGTGYEPAEAPCEAGTFCDADDGQCRDLCAEAAETSSYIGCEYYATTSANAVDPEFEFAIVVSNPQSVDAQVSVSGPATLENVTVAAGAVETIRLPWLSPLTPYRPGPSGELELGSVYDNEAAFHVESNVPVTVYQFNPLEYRLDRDCAAERARGLPIDGQCFSYTNDASLLLPTTALTGDYVVVSRPAQLRRQEAVDGRGAPILIDGQRQAYSRAPGFVTIVGADDFTVEVTVTSTAYTLAAEQGVAAMAPGDQQTIRLRPGAAVELITAFPPVEDCAGPTEAQPIECPIGSVPPCEVRWTYCEVDSSYDLTGTRVAADGAVSVNAGHMCAFVPDDRWACDHLEESMMPLQAWGNHVVAAVTEPLRGEPNVFRVVSGADANTITFQPPIHPEVTLAAGEHVEFEASEDFEVRSGGPISVGQFLVGQDYAGLGSTGPEQDGDPSFSLATPVEQFRSSYAFLAPETFAQSWVVVTASTGQTVTLDGQSVDGWRLVEGTDFQTARVRVDGGAHSMRSSAPFGVSVYGFGSYTSYMYPAGLDLRVINLI